MTRKRGRPRAADDSLSRERILDAALRLVDRYGVEALTMRGLAADLGVDPMAIYHHLPGGKDAILSGLVEQEFANLRVPQIDGAGWEEQVRACAHAYYEVVRAHPHLTRYVAGDVALVEKAYLNAGSEGLYAALFAAGLEAGEVLPAASLIIDFLHGYSLGESAMLSVDQEALWRRLEQTAADQFPLTRRVLAAARSQSDRIDHGLSIILAGTRFLRQRP